MPDQETILRGVILGQRHLSDVVLRNGVVAAVRKAGKGPVDAGSRDSIIAPTLFDIQVNGYGGVNLQGGNVSPEDVKGVSDALAAKGVSHWIPTLITNSHDNLEHGCRTIAEAMRDRDVARAVPGIHLEGPYISPMDGPRGAHPRQHVRPPSLREFDRYMKVAEGRIAYVTLAPEINGAVPFIKGLVKRGVVVSLGHHNGSADDISRAVDAGARLCTHLGNGLAGQINRHVNPLWPQLADDRLMGAFIADLEHLPAPALKIFLRAKGATNAILTSDVVYVAGLRPGEYNLTGTKVELLPSGRICLSGTEFLAGSSLWLLQGVVNAVRVTDMTLEQAFASATTIPRRLFGLRHRFAPPTPGKRADLIVFKIDKSRPAWRAGVQAVYVGGARKA